MKLLLIACLAVCCTLADTTTADNNVAIYRYWDQGLAHQRNDYQIAVLNLALEKTVKTHGKYQIIRKVEALSRARGYREIARGNMLNIHATPAQPTAADTDGYKPTPSIVINIPLMRGLLGYRNLIIRRTDSEKFSKIKDANQLKQLTAGHGRHWTDTSIYRHNSYKVVDDAEYPGVFAMLIAGRFDYLPLSVIEIDEALARSNYAEELMIVPNFIIYYPLPTIFHVSAKHPELAARLEVGLTLAKCDGSLDKLFLHHFSDEIRQLRSSTARVFILQNPNVASELGLDQPLLLK